MSPPIRPAQWRRQYGCPGCHGLLGSLLYSLPVTFGWIEGHVYYEAAASHHHLISLANTRSPLRGGIEAIKKLMGLRARGSILRDGVEQQVPVDGRVGDVVLVRPGEKFRRWGGAEVAHLWTINADRRIAAVEKGRRPGHGAT